MVARNTYGKTASGKPITDELVDELAETAEAGYDVEQTLRRRGGRPPLSSGPAGVESVRLEPETVSRGYDGYGAADARVRMGQAR